MRFSLREFKYYGGSGVKGSADSVGCLPWADVEELHTYAVYDGSVCLAQFEGHEADTAYAWLVDHADYDGTAGCVAWKGICAWCDKALVDGKCDCEFFGECNG